MSTYLHGIRSYLPEGRLTNEEICARVSNWTPRKIEDVTGIRERCIAGPDETAGDMGFAAANRLIEDFHIPRESVDALLFCTQSPDYFPSVPATACVLQKRLGLSQSCAAIDYSLGCSGYTYGLWLARSLILSDSARRILLITGDTICRNCDPGDITTAVNFGDAAAATLITGESEGAWAEIGVTEVGTDGEGAENLIVRGGGSRAPELPRVLSMNGSEVFVFSLTTVNSAIQSLMKRVDLESSAVDWYLMHQANKFMVESLAKKMNVPLAKVPVDVAETGNTSSASLPLLIERMQKKSLLKPGQHAVVAGFGVGFSWGVTHLQFMPGIETR